VDEIVFRVLDVRHAPVGPGYVLVGVTGEARGFGTLADHDVALEDKGSQAALEAGLVLVPEVEQDRRRLGR
jgi:hypothetical protein